MDHYNEAYGARWWQGCVAMERCNDATMMSLLVVDHYQPLGIAYHDLTID